jgi:hypothetical protein
VGFGRVTQWQQARKPAWCTLCVMCAAVVGGGVLLQFQECTKVLEVAVVGVLMLRVDDIAVPQRARTPSCLIVRSHVIHAGVALQRQADQGGQNRPFARNGQAANRPMGVSQFCGRGGSAVGVWGGIRVFM